MVCAFLHRRRATRGKSESSVASLIQKLTWPTISKSMMSYPKPAMGLPTQRWKERGTSGSPQKISRMPCRTPNDLTGLIVLAPKHPLRVIPRLS